MWVSQNLRSEGVERALQWSRKENYFMKHNVGSFDAAGRAVFGFVIIGIGHHYHTWWGLLGLVPFITAAVAFCPLYCLFHFNTTAQDEIDFRDGSEGPPPSRTKKV